MTPAPDDPSRAPTNANRPSTKQQRAESRARKTEEFKRQQQRRRRNRLIAIWSAVAAGVVVVALVVVSLVFAPRAPSYQAGGSGAEIEGVETFDNPAGHVEGPVDYPQTPPAGGEHNPVWLNCGVYSEPVPNENAVHSLEHGAVWITYDPALDQGEVDALRALLPRDYSLLSPYEGLDSPIVVSAWNAQLAVDSADDPRIPEFIEEYWQGGTAPEIGAPCTGALDGPGRVA